MKHQAKDTTDPDDLATPEYRRLVRALGEWLAALGYAQSTVYYVPRHAAEFFGWLERAGVTDHRRIEATTVVAYLGYVAERPNRRRGGGLSRGYVQKHRRALRLLARYLWESRQGGFSVPAEIRAGVLEREAPEVAVLTRTEVEALYEACDETPLGLRDRAMLAVYYGCGLRRAEGVALDARDVDLGGEALYVRAGKNYTERYVPLAWGALRDLRAYLDEARPVLAEPSADALFVSVRGRRIDGQSLLLRLRRLIGLAPELAGRPALPSVGLHTLRHSLATHLLQAGMEMEQIAAALGHRSLESTQRYTHLLDRLKRSDGRR